MRVPLDVSRASLSVLTPSSSAGAVRNHSRVSGVGVAILPSKYSPIYYSPFKLKNNYAHLLASLGHSVSKVNAKPLPQRKGLGSKIFKIKNSNATLSVVEKSCDDLKDERE